MMKDIEVCLSQMSNDELETLYAKVEAQMASRKKERFYELRKGLLDAVNALMEEFPYADCCVNIPVNEEECMYGETEIDLLCYLKDICPDCIHMHLRH